MTNKKHEKIHKDVFKKFNTKGNVSIPIKLKDGSVYEIDNIYWIRALDMRLQSDDISLEDFKEIVILETEKHWRNKTVPTKFGDSTWNSYLKDKFGWERYDKLTHERTEKRRKYFEKIGINYKNIKCSSWQKDLHNPNRKIKNYKIINEDVAIADSELNGGGKQLILKIDGKADKFEWKCTLDLADKQRMYADKKFRKFKGKIFKDMEDLAERVVYQYIRGFLMGIIMGEGTKGKGKAILLGKECITAVNDKGFIKVK